MLLAFAATLLGWHEMARRAAAQEAAQLHRVREQQLVRMSLHHGRACAG
jgi:hypothetical protein